MRNRYTFGIQFVIRHSRTKTHRAASVYARITVNQRRSEISLKRTVDPECWDDVKGVAKGKTEEIQNLNNHLERTRSQIAECYHQLVQQGKVITADLVKSIYLGEGQEEFTLCTLIEYHNTHQKEILSLGTIKNYYTTKKHITKFLKEKRRRLDIHLSELNYQFITDFERFLRSHTPTDHRRGLANNGVMKHLERLLKMIGLGIKLEWLERDPFQQYQLKFQRVERGYLTDEELSAIEKKTFSIERLQMVKNMFVFACYTGLSYSDLIQLKPGNIQIGIDGESWIKTNRQKTKTPVTTPILPEAMELISRYENDPRANSTGTIFPCISNQKLNSYLKEIADLCGINKNLTFHLARHTFATTVTLTNGVPIETVSKMLGHTKIATTQIYARVLEKKIGEDMALLRSRMQSRKASNV